MSNLKIISSWPEVQPYLEDKKVTLKRDVLPLLQAEGRAPFTISREVTSYIDHLGELYIGTTAVGNRFKKYLIEVLSKIDPNYRVRAGEIYEMYRCGTVHEFDPKELKNSKGQTLSWLCYYGERTDEIKIGSAKVRVTHLTPLNPTGDGKSWWLPMSTRCLVEDLIKSIDEFAKTGPEADRIAAWNRAAQRLQAAARYEFVVP
jgi:hypothetical protein